MPRLYYLNRWWSCCTCNGEANPDLCPQRCSVCGHYKCSRCGFERAGLDGAASGDEDSRDEGSRDATSGNTPSESATPGGGSEDEGSGDECSQDVPSEGVDSSGNPQFQPNCDRDFLPDTPLSVVSIVEQISNPHEFELSDLSSQSTRASCPQNLTFSNQAGSSGTNIISPDVGGIFIQEFTRLMFEDSWITALCNEALKNPSIGRDKLEKDLHQLLGQYAQDLSERDEFNEHQHQTVIESIRRSSRSISSKFCSSLAGESGMLDGIQNQPDSSSGREEVEAFLRNMSTGSGRDPPPVVQKAQDSDSDSLSEVRSHDNDRDIDATYPALTEMRRMLTKGKAYKLFSANVQSFVPGLFACRIQRLANSFLNTEYGTVYDIPRVAAELQFVSPDTLTIETGNKEGWVNRFQGRVEGWSQEKWDWWPLSPYMRPLFTGEKRVCWHSECGDRRWVVVPDVFADRLSRIVEECLGSHNTDPKHQEAEQTKSTGVVAFQPSGSGDTLGGLSGTKGKPTQGGLDKQEVLPAPQSNTTQTTSHVGRERYVLLLVRTGNRNFVGQIPVHNKNNNSFFQSLRGEYYQLRGWLRTWLSVWRYSHCEFYQFEKFDDSEYAIRTKDDYPASDNNDYEYQLKPTDSIPPISHHEFYSRFYACYLPNKFSIHWFHKCKCASSHSREVIHMLPKKLSVLEKGGDKREVFWGIYARERVSLMWILGYNIICILPLVVFFASWLFPLGHAADLQNAAVLLEVTIAMLSLFWAVYFGSLHWGMST